MSMKQKRKSREEILLQKKELRLQRSAKFRHSEINFRIHYSTSYFRKYAPEEVERRWIEDIENLKKVIAKYERRITGVEENSM